MSYTCIGTGKVVEGKPWITINMDRWDGISGPVTFSSYIAYNNSLEKIPKQHIHLVENKEDFNYLLPIVTKQSKSESFNFLTETEINKLTNEEYRTYKEKLQEYYLLNPNRTEIEVTAMEDDAYQRELEMNISTTDEEFDDY